MKILLKLPDLEGGFIYKSLENNKIVTRDNEGHILNEKPVNLIKKGTVCRYGKVIEQSGKFTVLQNGKDRKIMKSSELNLHLHKTKGEIEVNHSESAKNYFDNNVVGEYSTPVEGLTVNVGPADFNKIGDAGLLKSFKELITNPDLITEENGTQIFRLRKSTKVFSAAFQSDENIISGKEVKIFGKSIFTKKVSKSVKGDLVKCYTEETDKNKLLLKSNAMDLFGNTTKPKEPKIEDVSSGPSWNVKGGQKPDHKYIERKPHPSGEGYIYLYELPNGKKEWKDENGKSVKEKSAKQSAKITDFKKGDRVKQGDRIGKVEDSSDNFLAVNFEGEVQVINKKEHLEKVKQHSQLKEGMEFEHGGQKVRALRITDKLALVKNLEDNRLQVIKLEKEFQKQKDEKDIPREYDKANINYEQQDLFQEFNAKSNEAGLARVDDLTRKKYVKVGNQIRTVTWKYNPVFGDTTFLIDGVKNHPLSFGGENFIIKDITEEGFSLEDKEGNTGLFLSHEDYQSWRDEEAAIKEKNTVVRHAREGTYASNPSKTFHFKPEYTPEELEQLRGKSRRTSRYKTRWKENAPIQSEEDKQRLAAEQEKVNEEIKTSLKSEEYRKFAQFHESRDYKIQENRFIAKKTIDVEGNKFELRSHYDRKTGSWNTQIDGKVNKVQIGDQSFKIDDITKDAVYYDDGKKISIDELKQLNGKAIFKPTQQSLGLTSKNDASKVYFGTDDKNAVSAYYEVIESSDLIASHFANGEANNMYDISDAQNRDRSTPQSMAQITKIAANPNFDFVSDDRTAQNGAPIVNQDYNVIAGNGRGIGLQLHYQNGGTKYKQDLLANAERLGFSKDEISRMDKPILVRRTNIDKEEAQRLGAISNQDNKLALENRETAKGMATRIDDKTMNRLSDIFGKAKGDHSTLAAYLDEVGPDVVNELIRKDIIPENERHLFFDVDSGNLNAAHKDKIKDLLTQTMLGDSSKDYEYIPDASREGITKALGNIFALKGKEGDLTEHIQGAVKILSKYNNVKENFNGADDFISQDSNNAFEPLKASKEELAIFDLLTNSKPNEIKNKFQEYAAALEGDMFTPGMSPEEAFNTVFSPKYAEGVNKSADDHFVKDEGGKPLTVYHGTDKDFNSFENSEGDIFFTDNKKAAKNYGKNIKAAHLTMKNPKVIDFEGREDNDIQYEIEDAKEEGYDGLIVKNTNDGYTDLNQYVVFNNKQVSAKKSIFQTLFKNIQMNLFGDNKISDNPNMALQPSKKNPSVNRWQKVNKDDSAKKDEDLQRESKEENNLDDFDWNSIFDEKPKFDPLKELLDGSEEIKKLEEEIKPIKEQVLKKIELDNERLSGEIADWSSREYKQNKKIIETGGDGGFDIGTRKTIGNINENRRKRNIAEREYSIDKNELIQKFVENISAEDFQKLRENGKWDDGIYSRVASKYLPEKKTNYGRIDFVDDAFGDFISMVKETKNAKVPIETPDKKILSATGRFKPKEYIAFNPPLVSKNGAKLTGYEWKYEWEELEDDKARRISNWNESVSSDDTGRYIVHQYHITTPEGKEKIVSSESVLKVLGYMERNAGKYLPSLFTASKTLAKQKMQLELLNDEENRYNAALKEAEKMKKPEIKHEQKADNFNIYSMDDQRVIQHDNEPLNSERIETLTRFWERKKAEELSGVKDSFSRGPKIRDLENRIERQQRKIDSILEKQQEPVDNKVKESQLSFGGNEIEQMQLDFGFDEKSSEYETTEGNKIRYKSLNADNPALRKLEPGEYAKIERKYRAYKQLNFFTRTEKIESAEDVAFIFRSLEEESVEHVFVLHETKDNKLIVQQISQGNFNSSIVDPKLMIDAANRFGTEKLYFVHNHPSGNLTPSREDIIMRNMIERAMPGVITVKSLIIDARDGKYSDFTFDKNGEPGQISDKREGRKLKAISFTRQVHRDVNIPDIRITSPEEIASFLTESRFAIGKKFHILSIDSKGSVVGHFLLTSPMENKSKAVDEINALVTRSGGSRYIMVGNRFDDETMEHVNNVKTGQNSDIEMLDYIGVETDIKNMKSAVMYNKLKSFRINLRKAVDKFTNQLRPSKKNPSVKRWQKVIGPEEQTETENFKKWFGDSKVVDEDGNPLVVYHATNVNFDTFKESDEEIGIHFGTSEQANHRAMKNQHGILANQIIPVFLRIKKPLVLSDKGFFDSESILEQLKTSLYYDHELTDEDLSELAEVIGDPKKSEAEKNRILKNYLKYYGYDGLMYKNTYEDEELLALKDKRGKAFKDAHKNATKGLRYYETKEWEEYRRLGKEILSRAKYSYAVFTPKQIKSAIGNIGKFDVSEGDITKSIDTTKNKLLPSKKNPKVNRWQRIKINERGDEMEKPEEFAKKIHKNQKYGNGGDYYTEHILPVAEKAVEFAKAEGTEDIETVRVVALLHDALEDTNTTFNSLQSKYGFKVAYNVYLLSDKIKSEGRKFTKDEYYSRMSKSKIAKIVKAADRYVNVSKIKEIDSEKIRNKLTKKYKDEMHYYEKYGIYQDYVKNAFEKR